MLVALGKAPSLRRGRVAIIGQLAAPPRRQSSSPSRRNAEQLRLSRASAWREIVRAISHCGPDCSLAN